MTKFKGRILLAALAGCMVLTGCSGSGSSDSENTLFHQGLLAVLLDEKWGYIDTNGKYVINPQFDYAYNFDADGYAEVMELTTDGYGAHYPHINAQGEKFDTEYYYKFIKKDLTDPAEKDEPKSIKLEAKENYNKEDESYGLYGFVDYYDWDENWVIEPQFDEVDDFTENGLARVKLNEKWGFIDTNGNFVIEPQFDNAHSFTKEELALIVLNGKCGYIDMNGSYVINPQFDSASDFQEGLAEAKLGGKWGYIDTSGIFAIEPQFEDTRKFSEYGLAFVKLNGKWGCIDKKGAFVIEPKFDEIGYQSYYKGRYCGSCTFYNDGYAVIRVDNLYGIIDSKGNYIANPQFNNVQFLSSD